MEVFKWLGDHEPVPMKDLDEARERIGRYHARSQEPLLGFWAVKLRETGRRADGPTVGGPPRHLGDQSGVSPAPSLMCPAPIATRLWPMITIDSLTKRYGRFTAVDDVTFTASPGRVTGFLGPNGAGKSTTMRVMVGLTPPTAGEVTINGRRYADLPNPGFEVGVLLDASAQHAGRTGREILTIAQRTMGLPKFRVEEMLDRVSLTEAEAGRRVRNYSLGMRQRLGIATALIGEPQVLILDEPANGLDPAGIRWMRDLLRGYADQGGTVLLSSHLLHEIEVIADDLVLIGNGRIVAQGTKADLLAAAGTVVRSASPGTLARSLEAAGIVNTVSPDGAVRTTADAERVGQIALAAGVALTELRSADGAGLEEMFLELTAETQREGAAA
jgi:ABC-2 type transport system ATP-binding protein